LRHTFASHLVMRNVPLKAVQEFLGHRSIEMTMRYAHLAPAAQQAAVHLLDGPAPSFETPSEDRSSWHRLLFFRSGGELPPLSTLEVDLPFSVELRA
jgi:hypothetical protein